MTGNWIDVGARRTWAFFLAAILLVICGGGYWLYRVEAQRIRLVKYNELAAIGKLKADQIVQWRQERLDEVREDAESPLFGRVAAAWLKDSGNLDLRNQILQYLEFDHGAEDCANVFLLDLDGRILLAAKDFLVPVDVATIKAAAEAIGSKQAVFSDLFRSPDGHVYIDAVAPVSDADNHPIASWVLRNDATKFLYPLIQLWPIPSESAETLLVRKDGEDVLFLNEVRHQAGAALSLRIPLTQNDVPSVQAVRGKQGIFEGTDYRGVAVLADLRPVPGSPWLMVAKVDRSEILAELNYRAAVIAGFVVLFILLAAAAVAFFYRQRQVRIYRALLASERAKREVQELLRATLMGIGDGLIATDRRGRILFINPVAEKLTGWKNEEAQAKPLAEVFHIVNAQTRERCENPAEKVLACGEVVGLANDTALIARDGTEYQIADSGAPIYDAEGNVIGVVLVFRDVTEEYQMRNALAASEVRYRRLFESAKDGILIVDAETGVIVDVNPFLAELLGYSHDLFVGKRVWELGFFRDILANQDRFLELQQEAYIRYEDLPLETAEGRRIDVEFVSNVYSVNHEKVIQCNIRDITERKRAEAEKEKLEAQNRQLQKSESLGRMAGAIAHHFNNQLQTVMGNLEMALDELPRAAGGPGAFLTDAMQAAYRASEVSGLMLTYLGQTHGKQEPLDLSRVCQQCMQMLVATIPKSVVLESDLPAPGPVVSANENQMQQVLTNLVTNAWEAADKERCVVRLSVKTASASDISGLHRFPIDWKTQDNAYACLEVADSGCGIADKDIEKLFDPFFTTKFTGRGMGLAVVLGIVRAYEGLITVESEPGSGSIFRVYLPLSSAPVSHPKAQEPETTAVIEGGTVLVVEDEEKVRKVTATMLKSLGFAVLAAKDGVEAIEVFRQRANEIRFVLCDLTMPRMGGWETLTALRKIAPGIPVILASGYSEEEVMDGEHPELPQAFLGKPYRLQDLSNAIRQALTCSLKLKSTRNGYRRLKSKSTRKSGVLW